LKAATLWVGAGALLVGALLFARALLAVVGALSVMEMDLARAEAEMTEALPSAREGALLWPRMLMYGIVIVVFNIVGKVKFYF